MMRRDRHAPRWAQHRDRGERLPAPEPALPAASAVPVARSVPIEAGPPPAPEPVAAPDPVAVMAAATQAELPWSGADQQPETAVALAEAEPDTQPVPANDVVAGPMVQPIVIGAESAPVERKRGWWRRG